MDCPHCGKKIEADDEPWKSRYRDFVLIFFVALVAWLIASAIGFGWQVQALMLVGGSVLGSVLAVIADDSAERKWRQRNGA